MILLATSYFIAGFINVLIFIFIVIGVATNRVDRVSWTLFLVSVGLIVSKVTGLLQNWSDVYNFVDSQLLISIIGITMVLAILNRSGLLQLLTIAILRKTSSDFSSLVWILSALVLILSFLISNILAFIIVASITILIADSAEFDPKPLLFLQLVISNLSAILTPIASYSATYISLLLGWGYGQFIVLSLPFVIPVFFITVLFTKKYFKKEFIDLKNKQLDSHLRDLIRSFDPMTFINKKLIKKTIFVFSVVIFLLIFGQIIGMTIDFTLLIGIVLVLVIFPDESESILRNDVDWKLLFYLTGIFIISGLIATSNLITITFSPVVEFTEQMPSIGILVVTWVLGFLTIIIEDLPIVFVFQPTLITLPHQTALWWGVLTATHLTDSIFTISSVNGIVLTDMLKKEGNNISFIAYFKYGISITIIQYIFYSIYVIFLITIL